jgi:hypothetical protein
VTNITEANETNETVMEETVDKEPMLGIMDEIPCLADDYESDDSYIEASDISTDGSPQTHWFHEAGDEDWVSFPAEEGTQYVINTSNLGSASDTYIYLYDTDGETIIDENDDYIGVDSRIEWICNESGTYYVMVRHFDSGAYCLNTSYDIHVYSPPGLVKEKCQAIEDGVAWLVAQQNADGSWGASYPVAETAFAVLKLETHATDPKPPDGCGYGLDSPFDPTYPYAENVSRGLNYIFANAYTIDIGTQTHDGSVDNPDTNGNGKGVYFSGRRTYETSIALMAIAASRTPDRIVNVPGSPVNGWTYKDVAQDTVDYLAWGQTDSGYGRGGWSYAEMDNTGDRSDNSNTGFVVLGLLYAESNEYAFKIPIPQFVRDELNIWIDYIQCKEAGTNYGGSGYDSNPCGWVNTLKAGNLLFEMAFVGDTIHTQRVIDAVNYIERHWDDNNMQPGWRGDPAHYQAMYCLMKGLETLGIEDITVNRGGSDVKVNWFAEFADVLVSQQNADGSWNDCPSYVREDGGWGTHGGTLLCTEWALLTLQKEVPPPPIFCDPCVSIKVDVSINNNNGAIPYWPWNVFRYNVSVKNNQAYKPGKSRIAITYGLIDDPTSHTLIIGTRMPDIYLDDTYNISGDFRVPDDVYSGNYVFFASAFDMETGCCGCNAVPFSVEMPSGWISTTSKEESWENWLEIVED